MSTYCREMFILSSDTQCPNAWCNFCASRGCREADCVHTTSNCPLLAKELCPRCGAKVRSLHLYHMHRDIQESFVKPSSVLCAKESATTLRNAPKNAQVVIVLDTESPTALSFKNIYFPRSHLLSKTLFPQQLPKLSTNLYNKKKIVNTVPCLQ